MYLSNIRKNCFCTKSFVAVNFLRVPNLYIVSVVEVICPKMKQALLNISLSRNIVEQRIEEKANNIN